MVCRCCEYALLILEYWADAPEIQRSADLYEDLIKCCVADAMSEVSGKMSCTMIFRSQSYTSRSTDMWYRTNHSLKDVGFVFCLSSLLLLILGVGCNRKPDYRSHLL